MIQVSFGTHSASNLGNNSKGFNCLYWEIFGEIDTKGDRADYLIIPISVPMQLLKAIASLGRQ
jgi:hypothetical protein